MVRVGAPSMSGSAGLEKGVDGWPPPTMTPSGDSAALAAIISRRTLTIFSPAASCQGMD
jgi:hypothetical protein